MKIPKNLIKLAKYLTYVLGHQPDEFGLVADPEGFIKVKEVLKALSEEDGWRHVTKAALKEIQFTLPEAPIEMQANMIRAIDRSNIPVPRFEPHPPKVLFTAVRRRAYPRVVEKGVPPSGYSKVVLTSDREMAIRLGKRSDQVPVILTINTRQAHGQNILFERYGDALYLAPHIPSGCFKGPALPKERADAAKQPVAPPEPKTPGSFTLDHPSKPLQPKRGRLKTKRKVVDWKESRKKRKKHNKKFDNPY